MPSKNGRRAGGQTSSAKSQIRRLEHRMNGIAIKARNDPPTVVLRPWYNLTVAFQATGAATTLTHTVTSVRTQLLTQLGLPADTSFLIRLREIRAWGSLGGSITGTIHDPTTVGSVLTELQDTGSLTNRPHFGYILPSRVAMQTFNATTNALAEYEIGTNTIGSITAEIRYVCQLRFIPPPA